VKFCTSVLKDILWFECSTSTTPDDDGFKTVASM
jgi:hypothetical protein